MNGETGFWHSFGVWSVPVCRSVEGSEGSSPLGAHLRATDLYSVGSLGPDHDAVMRIGGKLRGAGPFPSVPMKVRHLSPGIFNLRAQKDHLTHAHAPEAD